MHHAVFVTVPYANNVAAEYKFVWTIHLYTLNIRDFKITLPYAFIYLFCLLRDALWKILEHKSDLDFRNRRDLGRRTKTNIKT